MRFPPANVKGFSSLLPFPKEVRQGELKGNVWLGILSILLSLVPIQHFAESIAGQSFGGMIPKLSANEQSNEMKPQI